jgi:peptide/nickel transport system substrate-binding protein
MAQGRLIVSLVAVVVGAGLLGAGASGIGRRAAVHDGGTFRIVFEGLDFVDPALSYSFQGVALLDATCARLMTYPDQPAPRAWRLVPEVATSYPLVSGDGKKFTFTLHRNFRFSNGSRVAASAFARAINRTLAPGVHSPWAQYTRDIVGARDVLSGKATSARGIVATGNRLVIKLTRPTPDFPARMAATSFCAVPPNLPVDPEGVGAFPAAGPYYVAQFIRDRRVVLLRNRYYAGTRPAHVVRFEVDITPKTKEDVLHRIDDGHADWGTGVPPPIYFDPARRLVAKYGINKSRFFVKPGLSIRAFALNTSRPLFHNNIRLRRAVNFAVDRAGIRRVTPGGVYISTLTDQFLPPGLSGFRNARLYPANPNVRRAKALAAGHTRTGKVVLYTFANSPPYAYAQVLKRNLEAIGLDVDLRGLPASSYGDRLVAPGEPWDIAFWDWTPDYIDPYAYLNVIFDGRFVGGSNVTRFNSDRFNRLLRAAARLRGRARYVAYGKVDVQLARDAAPMIPIDYLNQPTLVSKRVGCIVLRPELDLAASCLK